MKTVGNQGSELWFGVLGVAIWLALWVTVAGAVLFPLAGVVGAGAGGGPVPERPSPILSRQLTGGGEREVRRDGRPGLVRQGRQALAHRGDASLS